MVLPVNGERGEVGLRIGTVDLVIAAEIGRLAAVSTALECKSFVDLYRRLLGVEIAATLAALRLMSVQGEAEKAIAEITLDDFPVIRDAIEAALTHHMKGKVKAVGEGAAAAMTTSPSPSETG